MSTKLSASNPYLRDPAVRKRALWISAKTSSAIEGIHKPFATPGPAKASARVSRKNAKSA
jgi:hypothetical protein